VHTARCALALQSGTTIAWEDDATLPACIQARALSWHGQVCAAIAPATADLARARQRHQSSPEHLQHLLLNLTVFCVRAADGQPVRVSARCAAAAVGVAARMHTLVLHVAASGLVLSAAQLATAFDPYTQDSGADANQRVRAVFLACMQIACLMRRDSMWRSLAFRKAASACTCRAASQRVRVLTHVLLPCAFHVICPRC
jgi:hypothetical protein